MDKIIEDVLNIGEVFIVGGQRCCGKTALLAWVTRAVQSEGFFLGHRTHRPVTWATAIIDRGDELHREWWRRAGFTEPPGPVYTMTNDLTPKQLRQLMAKSDGLADLWVHIMRTLDPQPGSVLVIDVISPFIGNVASGYMAGFASGWSISREARERGIAIIGAAHGGKPKRLDAYERWTDRIIANSGFLGAVDSIAYLATDIETAQGGMQRFVMEPHLARAETFLLRRTDNGLFEVVPEEVETIDEPRWSIYNLPTGEEPPFTLPYMTTAQIISRAATVGIPARTVERDLAAMERLGVITRYKGQRGKWQRRILVGVGGGEPGKHGPN